VVNLEANEIQSAGLPAPWSRYADWAKRNPLPSALAIQAALLFYRLDLLNHGEMNCSLSPQFHSR
jgi:hypothetical protein